MQTEQPVAKVFPGLPTRTRFRWLLISNPKMRLVDIALKLGVTKERVRQIASTEGIVLYKKPPIPRYPCRVCGEPVRSRIAKPKPKHKHCIQDKGEPCIVCGEPIKYRTKAALKWRTQNPSYLARAGAIGSRPPQHRTCKQPPEFWPCGLCGRGIQLGEWQRLRFRRFQCSDILCDSESCRTKFKEQVLPAMDSVGRARYKEEQDAS